MIRMVKRPRSLEDIIEQIGQGYLVKDWKKQLKRSNIIDQINSLCEEEYTYLDSDLTEINYIMLGTFIPRFEKKLKVSSWQEAQKLGVMRSYFGNHDIFNISEGYSDNYIYSYDNDYYDYIRSLEIEKRILHYRTYLMLNSCDIPIKDNSFSDGRYFVDVAMRQFPEYEGILSEIVQIEGDELVFLGDGIGIGAMISIKNGWDYYSVEEGGIGRMPIQLGLIHDVRLDMGSVRDNQILVLCNVEEYLTDVEVSMYNKFFRRIIVITEKRKSRIGTELSGTDAKVYVKGVCFHATPRIREIAKVEDYLAARAPVTPVDRKSEIFVRGKMEIAQNGFPISYGNVEGAFNIKTRAYPGNITMARKGDIKVYKHVKFKYEEEGQVVFNQSEAFMYYPDDPGRSSILLQGKYREEKDFIVAIVVRPRQIRRYVDPQGIINSIYYLYSKQIGDKCEAYYSKVNVGVPNVVTGEDYVVKGDYG